MTQRRALPRFAPLTFRAWFAGRPQRNARARKGRVVLWPDTFTNTFHPEVGVAAVQLLERAGFDVALPSARVCCGRPLYDYGMLSLARRYLGRCLDTLELELAAGTPVVGLEPSCVAVFKDELGKLMPDDVRARRLAASTSHLAEFLRANGMTPPARTGRALLWGHCHQKATGGLDADRALLEDSGLQVDVVSGGCCGLAGSWGFESGHYDISVACGDHALLPAVRNAPPGTLVVANGFSCRTQIEQETSAYAVHLAQVLVPTARRPKPTLLRRVARAATVAVPVALAAGRR
jgi:Fe-S oxidoreductase